LISFFNNRFASWTIPLRIIIFYWDFFVDQFIFVAIFFKTLLNMERPWTVITTNQISSIFAIVAMVSILNWLV
jgi:hypothetical protein